MESGLKDNAHYITVGNTIGLIGVAVYFKKQNEMLQAEVDKIRKEQQAVLSKILTLEEKENNQVKAISKLTRKVDTVSADRIENLYHQNNWQLDPQSNGKTRKSKNYSPLVEMPKHKKPLRKRGVHIEESEEETEYESDEEQTTQGNTISKRDVINTLRQARQNDLN